MPLLATLGFVSVSYAQSRALSTSASAVYVESLTVPYGTSVTFQTTNLAGPSDPVLHLLRVNGPGSYSQVAYNDNYIGLNARVYFYNSSPSASAEFLLVLRAKSPTTLGACDLLKNGLSHQEGAPVSGTMIAASMLDFNNGDEMRTVHVPGGSVAPTLFKFSTPTGLTISGLGLGNGVGGASIVSVNGSEYFFLVGTPWLRDGTDFFTPRDGAALVMANDLGADTDGDGVGNLLETELQLCASTSGCPNNGTGHGRDTDRDGLSDGEELWGVAGTLSNGIDDLPFSRWGANSRQKDVFVEVDYLTKLGGPLATGTNPFQWMRDNPAGSLAGWTGSPEDWVEAAQAPFLAGPADHLHNPNGLDGVAVHFDLGVAPTSPADESNFGSWSTGAARGLVPDWIIKGLAPVNGDITVKINSWEWTFDATGWTGAQLAAIIGIGVLSSGEPVAIKSFIDNGDDTAVLIIESSTNGLHFDRELTVSSGFESSLQLKDESDGSLRDHYEFDPLQVDAVRFGRLRYGIITVLGDGGAAERARFGTGLRLSSFVHELGHTLALEHRGHDAWDNAGVDCMPHYQSLMRYANAPYRFSDVDGTASLNPAQLVEFNSFGAAYDYGVFAPPPYNYSTTTTSVDWNRDGSYSPVSSNAWRTTALSLFGGSCKTFVQGRQQIGPTEDVEGAVALVRGGTRLYAFWATGTAIRYKFASLGAIGNKSCTGSSRADATNCLTWSATYVLTSDANYLGVTAALEGSHIFLASNATDSRLRMRRLAINGSGTLSTISSWGISTLYPEYRTDVAPQLVHVHDAASTGSLAMLYLAETGIFRRYSWTGSTWTNTNELKDPSGVAIAGGESPAAMAWWPPGAAETSARTIALLPSDSSASRAFVLDYTSGRWIDLALSGLGTTDGKPFIAYKHLRHSDGNALAGFPGHFMFGNMSSCSDGNTCAYLRLSQLVDTSNPPGSGLMLENVGDYMQNVWAVVQDGTSFSLYSDFAIDNVFGLGTSAVNNSSEYGLNFYPHADGAPDQSFNIYSDFRVMEDGICSRLGAERGFDCGTINVLD